MRARQRERCGVVIESRRSPTGCSVAYAAVGREPGRNVIGRSGPREICLVAGVARGGRRCVVVVRMALGAGHSGMHARQRIVRVKRVVEFGVIPVRCVVANSAIMRQAKGRVRRIGGVIEIHRMRVARIAVCRRSRKNIIGMAVGARQGSVRPGERIARVFQMVELGAEPAVHRVATLAGGREPGCDMVDDRGPEVLLMAGVASC